MKKQFILLLLFFSANLFAQAKIDSLEQRLKIVTGKEKIEVLNKLANEYFNISPKKILEYGEKALKLAEKEKNEKGIIDALYYIGAAYSEFGDYDKALECLSKCIENAKRINYKEGLAKALNNTGYVYRDLSEYGKALKYYQKALKLFKEIGNKKGVALSLLYIAYVNWNLDNYDNALEYFLKALKINEEIGDKQGIAKNLNGMGILYWKLANYDKALEYYQKSLKITKELGVKKRIAYVLQNIGIVYHSLKNYDKALEYYLKSYKIIEECGVKNAMVHLSNNIGVLYKELKKYNKALEYSEKSIKVAKEIGNTWGVVASLCNIGEVYIDQRNYNKALPYIKESLKLSKEIKVKDVIKDNYNNFSKIYSGKANYKKALEYYKLYTEVKDSIYTKESSDKIAEMQTKYETEKKEKENEILRKNNEIQNLEITRQRNFRNSFIVISGLILILVIVIYSRYRAKQKTNKILNDKNIQIEKANNQLSDKNKQITEQKDQLSKTLTELRETQKTLVDVAHHAGMAEIATGILHNVGNVLNSVKVSSQILKERIEKSKISGLNKALGLIKEHTTDLGGYITSDEKGKLLPEYLIKVGEALGDEQDTYLNELSNLHTGVDHIEEIVRVQQDYAGGSGIVESASLSKMMDDALRMNQDIFNKHEIKVVKHFKETAPISAEKGKLMQVFVNIIKNAWESLLIKDDRDKVITINISEDKENKCQIVDIIDNGIGVAKENLNKIFSYGFTTKKDGKGYGLHTSAIIMAKLNGKVSVHSNKGKKGATFTVVMPNSNQDEEI